MGWNGRGAVDSRLRGNGTLASASVVLPNLIPYVCDALFLPGALAGLASFR